MPTVCPQQIAELFDRHAGALELYASTWTKQPDDCVQEAFIALARETEAPDNTLAWLYKVTRNLALNLLRSRDRRQKHETAAINHEIKSVANPASDAEQNDRNQFLQTQLSELSLQDRELIVARIWGGLTWQQLSTLTDLPKSTVERRYHNALSRFKKLLESKCTTDLL